jgi:hypothetical protein
MLPGIRWMRRLAGRGGLLCLSALILVMAAPGCDTDPAGIHHWHERPAGLLESRTDCKVFPVSSSSGERTAIQDCFYYVLERGDTLTLTHKNAAFNCCPGEITADISFSNDTITIVERETEPMCHCLCLYDLYYRFENIEPGTYTIIFVEPYTTDTDEPLRATVDLSVAPSGRFCVDRASYPWNTGGGSTEPIGVLISHTDCHSGLSTAAAYKTPTDMSCVDWRYSGDVLRLKHINAGFNCCPGDITADITVEGDTILIVEHEEQSMCDCSCLYDLEFEIRNLDSRKYAIRIVELYTQPGDERLDFSIDLTGQPAGVHCTCRTHYPWGYLSSKAADEAVLAAMRREIVGLIGTPSCGGDGECRYIGLGDKPCGGVWEYLVYSTSTVDTVELKYLVSRYNAFNKGYNCRYNIASDCMFVIPPEIGCIEGRCAAIERTP